MRERTGLWFMCEVDGGRRITVRQEWTDRGVPAASDRLAVDGLFAARALVDAIDAARTSSTHEAAGELDLEGSDEPGTRTVERAGPAPSGDGGLNAAGLLTGKGKPFTTSGFARVRDAYKIWAPRTLGHPRRRSQRQTAAQLGIHADAIYNWLIRG